MAKIIELFSEVPKNQSREDKIRQLFSEAVDNSIPLMVIKLLFLITSLIFIVLLLLIGVFSDPVINKVFAALALTGAFVCYFILGIAYYIEKRTGKISVFLRKT